MIPFYSLVRVETQTHSSSSRGIQYMSGYLNSWSDEAFCPNKQSNTTRELLHNSNEKQYMHHNQIDHNQFAQFWWKMLVTALQSVIHEAESHIHAHPLLLIISSSSVQRVSAMENLLPLNLPTLLLSCVPVAPVAC